MPNTRVEVAERILRSAGELILKHFGGQVPAREKVPGHFVTAIDLMVDHLVVDSIRQQFPKDKLFTEESGFIGHEGEYLWIVDPIDGTSNLRLGLPYLATGLAVQYAGETVLSAVYNPFLDQMVIAERGSGAFLNGERLRVSSEGSPSIGYYVQGYGVPPSIQLETLRVLLPNVKRVLNTWAPMLDWCNIARGQAEFLVGYDTEMEDAIQGKLILEEAGGQVTTWDNRSLHLDLTTHQRITLLGTNGAVHEQLCDLLDSISPSTSLRGYVSSTEEELLEATIIYLKEKLGPVKEVVAERVSVELGLPQAKWERNTDLRYLVAQAEAFQNDLNSFIRYIFDGIAPHLSGETARSALLDALKRVAEVWKPEEQPLEVVAQALKIAASDVRLHDRMQAFGYNRKVIDDLVKTLPEDSFAVGTRLKRNSYRNIRALERIGENEPLAPIYPLSELDAPKVEDTPIRTGTKNGFAALIITGGRGTRLRTSVPKGLIPLNQRPLINYTLDAFRTAGASDIAVVVGYKADLHAPVLDQDLMFLKQTEQNGTAHAVMAARSYFADYEGPLLVSYSDMPLIEGEALRTLVEKHCAEDAVMTLLTTDRKSRPEFGRILRQEGKVSAISQVRFEAVDSDEVDAGFYCFKAPDFWEYLGRIQNANNRREFILTEIITHLSRDEQKIETYFIEDIVQTIGINRPAELIQAECIAYLRSKLQKAGAESVEPGAELYWKLRFYEGFGGIRADQSLKSSTDPVQLNEYKKIIAAYDQAVEQEIGSIFRCPSVS